MRTAESATLALSLLSLEIKCSQRLITRRQVEILVAAARSVLIG